MGKSRKQAYAERIQRVINHIYGHLDEDLSVERLSEVAGFSKFHFHRQFSSYAGISINRLIQLIRLKRASLQLFYNRKSRIIDIALECGFSNPESFSRAFRKVYGQTPSRFRKTPRWDLGQINTAFQSFHPAGGLSNMKVSIVDFPETRVAVLEHHGPQSEEYNTVMKFIEWRKQNGIAPDRGRTYGIHYTDPKTTPPEDYRLDVCVSVDEEVKPNAQGVINKVIPAGRCAVVRHEGSRDYIPEAEALYFKWLPDSGEELRDFPIFFHYVNVGPDVAEQEMITDIYLPLV